MADKVLAAVQVGDSETVLEEFERPEVGVDGALLRVEAAGVCGSDIASYGNGARAPRIMGHENVGRIAEIGAVAADLWGVGVGDRVVLEEYLPCWHCAWCRSGEYRLCYGTDVIQNPGALRFGGTRVSVEPSLWGGYSQYLYLPRNTIAYKVSEHVPGEIAAMVLPMANGIQWARIDGGVTTGSSVLVVGPGQQGLGCVVAAVDAGAARVLVSGLPEDGGRLAVAERLGADATVASDDPEVLAERVMEATDGVGVDAVVHTVPSSASMLATAVAVLKRKGGTLVTQARGDTEVTAPLGAMASKYVGMKVTRGHSSQAVQDAIRLIEGGRHRLDLIATDVRGLSDVDLVLRRGLEEKSDIHVTIDPWA